MSDINLPTYSYLGDVRIALACPAALETRIAQNIEEAATAWSQWDCRITARESSIRRIIKDKAFPYLWTNECAAPHGVATRFYRYGTHTRTISVIGKGDYLVDSHVEGDEGGVLKCMRHFYWSHEASTLKCLVHASLVRVCGTGVLVVGACRSGKTTLTIRLLDAFGGTFVSEGNTLLEWRENRLVGKYIPRPVYVRFAMLNACERLRPLLNDVTLANATQPFDPEAIERILAAKAFEQDAGLNMSRRTFVQLMEADSAAACAVDRIIFPVYRHMTSPERFRLSARDAAERLRQNQFPKDTTIGKVQRQSDIRPPQVSPISEEWTRGIPSWVLQFSGASVLSDSLLRSHL